MVGGGVGHSAAEDKQNSIQLQSDLTDFDLDGNTIIQCKRCSVLKRLLTDSEH
jgi:hypothetical protein